LPAAVLAAVFQVVEKILAAVFQVVEKVLAAVFRVAENQKTNSGFQPVAVSPPGAGVLFFVVRKTAER
jgi:hypothetical protein